MPTKPTYPGVYIEEIPSGVRTIVGIATSITAFVGRAQRGPVNKAMILNNFGDFERIFGGLWTESTLGYTVRDFFQNGGTQAVVVRLVSPYFETSDDRSEAQKAADDVANATSGENPAAAAKAARAKAKEYDDDEAHEKMAADFVADMAEAAVSAGGDVAAVKKAAADAAKDAAPVTRSQVVIGSEEGKKLTFEAAYEGEWGRNLRMAIDNKIPASAATALKVPAEKLFNLTVVDTSPGGRTEVYPNLSLVESPRRADRLLKEESRLVRWAGDELGNGTTPDLPFKDDKPITDDATTAEADAAEKKAALEKLRRSGKANGDLKAAEEAYKKAQEAVTEKLKAMGGVDGSPLTYNDFFPQNAFSQKHGLYALEQVDLFNMLVIPPYLADGDVDPNLVADAAAYCEKRRAILIVDPPSAWKDKDTAREQFSDPTTDYVGTRSANAALYFPRIRKPNPLHENRMEEFTASGAIAGIIARTDAQRGLWKAPAGLAATLVGVPQLAINLTDAENGELNPLGMNCLRALPAAGRVVWGARTLQGDDRLASEWKYLPVRRLALYIEESLYRGTQWVVFEPNDEPLWAQIRLNVGAFMNDLFRKGAFQGQTPRDAYFVRCDKETTPQNDIDQGIVNIVVGFAPLKPAEFVIIKIQQIAGQLQT